MNAIAAEWVKKGEDDYNSIRRDIKDPQDFSYDSSCFHAQQAAEKYLKAYLQENNVPFPKIHDLRRLLSRCMRVDSTFASLRAIARLLDEYEVRYRYPGDDATMSDAQAGLKAATEIRDFVRAKLGL